jgi:hypothetical protein
MPSLYDVIADSCAALAAKAKHKSDKVQLLQFADQWRTVPADRQGPGKKPPASPVPVTDNVNRATLLSRPAPQGPGCRLDSASDEIEERNKQLESKTDWAKKEAVERARDAIGVLRQLGIDVDTILEDLGFSDGARSIASTARCAGSSARARHRPSSSSASEARGSRRPTSHG